MSKQIQTRKEDDIAIVAVGGEVDLSWSSEVRKEILTAVRDHDVVLVELADVSYIDSSGIAALVEGFQTAKQRNTSFGLLRVSAAAKSVLALARLDKVFPIYDTIGAAKA